MVGLSRRRAPGEERAYTITLPTALYHDLQRIAEQEGRSMHKQMLWALAEHVAARRAQGAPKAAKAAAA